MVNNDEYFAIILAFLIIMLVLFIKLAHFQLF